MVKERFTCVVSTSSFTNNEVALQRFFVRIKEQGWIGRTRLELRLVTVMVPFMRTFSWGLRSYQLPIDPTLQNVDACFLTFHSFSTTHIQAGFVGCSETDRSLKLSLPTLDSHLISSKYLYGNKTELKLK
ncbi:hypothetical protein Bca4012_063689 [Brassica carinata]